MCPVWNPLLRSLQNCSTGTGVVNSIERVANFAICWLNKSRISGGCLLKAIKEISLRYDNPRCSHYNCCNHYNNARMHFSAVDSEHMQSPQTSSLSFTRRGSSELTNAASHAKQQRKQLSSVSKRMNLIRWNFSSSSKQPKNKKNSTAVTTWNVLDRVNDCCCSSVVETRTEDNNTFVDEVWIFWSILTVI